MARKKISEFRAKSLLYQSLEIPYAGILFSSSNNRVLKIDSLPDKLGRYVLKVDEGIKRRFKKGLVFLNVNQLEVKDIIKSLQEKGHTQFLIEPHIDHDTSDEKFLAIERVREGLQIYFSNKGGIDIEENQDSVEKKLVPYSSIEGQIDKSRSQCSDVSSRLSASWRIARAVKKITNSLGIEEYIFTKLLEAFDKYYFSFLEINPFLIHDTSYILLDAACEVDSEAEFFVDNAWTSADFVEGEVKQKTVEEKSIEELSSKSQASFKLNVLNPNGSIFMLLSGGGASIVLADEVANLGKGKELANYGEYSGNPNAEETYIYTKNLLSVLLKSTATQKVLIIAGGVANFTDVRITFRGIIKALTESKEKLKEANVKVFVRRGGPYQDEGLKLMREFLEKEKLYGQVEGPEMVLTEIVSKALLYLK